MMQSTETTLSAAGEAPRRGSEGVRLASDDEQTFFTLLDRAVKTGHIRFRVAGRRVDVGRVKETPDVVVDVRDSSLFRRVLREGDLGLGETFMNEGWRIESGSVERFLTILAESRVDEAVRQDPRMIVRMGLLRAKQLLAGGRANSRAHYDLGEELYDTFLDPTRGYTCGYQKKPDDTLSELQENKYDRICQKLRLKEGETLFDLGCGYGGLMLHAAQRYGVTACGITNSDAHGRFVMRRVTELGLEGRVVVEIGDFRTAHGCHDKVASVGVLEHLYPHEHRAFFKTITRLLQPEGYGLVHTLGCVIATNDHDPFIQKYIFPGSTQNPISVITRRLERNKLAVLDVENIARHYLPTCRAWLEGFRANKHLLDPKKYDGSFLRMWEYYLALGVAAAQASDGAVWQVLFTGSYRRPLPMARV
jgi:cyclopropane-fatty-acyl-phospholipid synthase